VPRAAWGSAIVIVLEMWSDDGVGVPTGVARVHHTGEAKPGLRGAGSTRPPGAIRVVAGGRTGAAVESHAR